MVPAPRTRYTSGSDWAAVLHEDRTESRHAASLHGQRQVQYAASLSRVKHFCQPKGGLQHTERLGHWRPDEPTPSATATPPTPLWVAPRAPTTARKWTSWSCPYHAR